MPTDGETLAGLWRVAEAAREAIEARDEMSKMGSELEKSENIWQVFSSRPRTIARWMEAETELRAALKKLPAKDGPESEVTPPPPGADKNWGLEA